MQPRSPDMRISVRRARVIGLERATKFMGRPGDNLALLLQGPDVSIQTVHPGDILRKPVEKPHVSP